MTVTPKIDKLNFSEIQFIHICIYVSRTGPSVSKGVMISY